jgi:hypothetical protein
MNEPVKNTTSNTTSNKNTSNMLSKIMNQNKGLNKGNKGNKTNMLSMSEEPSSSSFTGNYNSFMGSLTGKVNDFKNYAINATEGGFSKLLIISTLLGFVIIAAIIYFVVQAIKDQAKINDEQNPVLIGAPKYAFDKDLTKKSFKVPQSKEGLAFTYTFWMYISDWRYRFGKWKNIFIKGKDNNRAPGIWLYPNTNSLHCRINTYADPNEGCDVQNIPLQKWVHVCYVLDNRTVDIYINGKLERSCVLRGIPKLNNDDVYIAAEGDSTGSGFYGLLSKFQYLSRALTPSQIMDKYSEGPLTTPSYSVKFFTGGKFVETKAKSGDFDADNNPTDIY